ncbi:MAG: PAS domain S-box protein [Microscillaceae bacterium]|nr:PAS domain S-box protein [Microscillaceae bacterium]
MITNPQGLTEWCNEGLEKLTGYKAQEFIGRKPGLVLQGPKTDPKTKACIQAKLKTQEPFQEEILNYHKEGFVYWVLLDITPILDAQGELTHYIGIQTDITERKKYENALQLALAKEKVLNRQLIQKEQELATSEEGLRASLEQLRHREEALEMLVRQAPVGIQIMNAEGYILSVNAAWKKCFGVGKSDLSQYNLFQDSQLLGLTLGNPLPQLLEGQGLEITDYEYDARLAFGEGHKIWITSLIYPLIDSYGQVKSLIMLHQDLSERKRTERQLFESTQLTQSIFQHSAAMIYAKNREGQYTKVNRQTADFFGTTIAKMMGKTAHELMQAEEARRCREREASLLDEPRIVNFQMDLQNLQGQNRIFQATEFPLFDEMGHVNGLAGIAFDMTDQIEKDRLYRLLAENTQDVIVYYDQDLKMRFASPSITLLTGFTVEEAMQMENFAVAHPDDRPELLQNLQKWLEDRVRYSKYSYRMVHKDGTVFWVESVTRRNFDEQGRLQEIIVNLRSIQEQMLARQELKASELKYRCLVEQSRDIIAMVNTQNLMTFISPAFQKILGHDPARLNEPGFMEKIIHPDDLARFRDFWEFYFQHQYFDEERLLQMRWLNAEGEEIFLENSFVNLRDEKGQVIGFQTLGRDITARRRAEERLRRSEASLKSIFDAAAESFFLIDQDFRILQFNRAAQEIVKTNFGLEPKIGDNIYDYGDPNTFEDFRRKVARAWQGDKVFSEREISVNGRKYWFEVQYLPAYEENGEIMGVAFVSLDITQRKQDEMTLLLSRENLSINQKIARLGSWSFQTDNRLICLRTEMLVLLGYTEEPNDLYLPLAEYLQLHVEEADQSLFLHYFAGPPFVDADGKTRIQVEFAYKAKTRQGDLRDFYVIAHYLAYEKSIIGVTQDITERKRNEAEREKMLYDLKRFAFMTSHNLRRPLANILGLVYIFKENEPEDPLTKQ